MYITEPTDTFTVSGRVIAYPGMEPIPGATYTILTGNQTGTSDPNGYFEVANLSPGTYQVVVSAAGYSTSRVYLALTVPQNKTNNNRHKDIYLLENSGEIELTVRGQDLGEVLSGVTVEAVAVEFPSELYDHQIDPSSLTSTGQTDENGQVTLTGLPAAGVWIAALAHDADGDQELDYGTQTLRFRLDSSEPVAGHLVMPTYSGDTPEIIATNLPSNYGPQFISPAIYFVFSVPMQTSGSTLVSLTQDYGPYMEIPVTATWTSDIRLEVTPIEPLSDPDMDYDFNLTTTSNDGLPFSTYRNSIFWLTGTDPVGGSCEEVVTDLVVEDPAGYEIDFDTRNIMLTWSAVSCSGGYRIYARDDRNNTQWVYLQDEPTDYEAGTISTVCSLPPSFDRYDVDGLQTPFAGIEVTFCVVPKHAVFSTPGLPHGTAVVRDDVAPTLLWVTQIGDGINHTGSTSMLEFEVVFSEFLDPAVTDPVIEVTENGGDPAYTLDPASATWIWYAGLFSGRFSFELPVGADASGDNIRVTLGDLTDLAGNTNSGPFSTPWQNVEIWGGVFDFESSPQGWTKTGPGWEWGTPTIGPGGAHSGVRCWGLSLNSNYEDNWVTELVSGDIFVPGTDPNLTFWCWYELDYYDDYVRVYASDGVSVMNLENFTGIASSWTQHTFDLTEFAGQNIQLRFSFTSNNYGNDSGFFLDDVVVGVEGK